MKPLSSALFFPETAPAAHAAGKLLLFFDRLFFYLPAESEDPGSSEQELLKDLCTGYAPVPLNEDLNRFNRLLREMENSRHDDLARLFSSALAPISSGQIRDKDETSTGSVVSTLHKDNEKKTYVQQKERLWQARLILKLAEILDSRENEVRQGLARIAAAEQRIFSALEGSSDVEPDQADLDPDLAEFARSYQKTKFQEDYSTGGSAALISIRLKAWAELYLADPSPDRPFLLVTANSNCADFFLERYEKIFRKIPNRVLGIALPPLADIDASPNAFARYLAGRDRLRQAAGSTLQNFTSLLAEAAGSQDNCEKYTGNNNASRLAADWLAAIKNEFPGPDAGLQKLDFYCFPDTSPAALLQNIFHLEAAPSAPEQNYTSCLLAVLHS